MILVSAVVLAATAVASTDTVVVLTPGGTGSVISAVFTLAVFCVGWLFRHFTRGQR